MQKKPLKPPFYRLTATCHQDGEFTVERKPNPKSGQKSESGGVEPAHSLAIVCPKCTHWATVTGAELVTEVSGC